jgi:hypothetical protein
MLFWMLFCRKYLLGNGYKTKEQESAKVEAVAAMSSASDILTSLIRNDSV